MARDCHRILKLMKIHARPLNCTGAQTHEAELPPVSGTLRLMSDAMFADLFIITKSNQKMARFISIEAPGGA